MFGRLPAEEDHETNGEVGRSHIARLLSYKGRVRFTLSAIAAAVGGQLVGDDADINGATIDSRSVAPGQLFVPIVAERDGHDFIEAAIANGAGGFLSAVEAASINGPSADPSGNPTVVPHIRVADTGQALLDLGRLARARLPEQVIGVTGSVGKTSTKDLIAAACGAGAPTHANPASFNNELGLPLTLINAPSGTSITVLEMGARGPGHIADLCAIGAPTIGVVTRVALAHGEFFGSLEGVAAAKGELIEALPSTGTAVLNADDPLVAAMAQRTDARVVTYGRERGDIRIENLVLDPLLRPSFELVGSGWRTSVALVARGAHMAENAAAAVSVALAAGIDVADAVRGLADAAVSPSRMSVEELDSGAVLIDDAYNANPTSVTAALHALTEVDVDRRIAVLGVMAELGDDTDALHRQIAELAQGLGVRLIAVGAPAYGPSAEHVADRTHVAVALGLLATGDAVLVKGSLVAGLQQLADELRRSSGGG